MEVPRDFARLLIVLPLSKDAMPSMRPGGEHSCTEPLMRTRVSVNRALRMETQRKKSMQDARVFMWRKRACLGGAA